MIKLIIIPLVAATLAQLIKIIFASAKQQFSWHEFINYGGMPSSHSAIVTSLCTVMGLSQGINSPSFALSTILAVIVIRDAIGLRGYLSQHARILNRLVQELPSLKEDAYPFLEQQIAHSPWQVSVGICLGIVVSLILYPLF